MTPCDADCRRSSLEMFSSGGRPCFWGGRSRGLIGSDLFGGLRRWDFGFWGFFFFSSLLGDENAPGNIFAVYLKVFDGRFRSGSDIGKPAFVPSNG